MKLLPRLLARVDPLFETSAFDPTLLPEGFTLHPTHKELLERRNGGYFWGGALHVFGAVAEPAYHSLKQWNRADGWRALYGERVAGLVFFAEDAYGDQFAQTPEGKVVRLRAESGEIEELADDFDQWLLIVVEATDELLERDAFILWARQNGSLPRGSQIQAYPPVIFAADPDEIAYNAVDAEENMGFHGSIVAQLDALPPDARVRIDFTEEGMQIVEEPLES